MIILEFSDYSDSKASEILWQYCRDEPDLDVNNAITDFNAANAIIHSIKIKEKINRSNKQDATKNVEIIVPLEYLSNFWTTLEVPLINCEINLDLTWYQKCNIVATAVPYQGAIFQITDTKLYVPVVIL